MKQVLVVVKGLATTPDKIGDDQLLTSQEIGLDSLSLLEVIVRLESEFEVLIPDSEVFHAQLQTVEDLTELVAQQVEHEGMESGT
ncbi:acyl carrier protein [Streptomyces sp. NPDC054770]